MIDRNDAEEQLNKMTEVRATTDEYMCLALNFILRALYDIREQNEYIKGHLAVIETIARRHG